MEDRRSRPALLRFSILYLQSATFDHQSSILNPPPTMPIHCLGFGLVTYDHMLLLDEFPLPNQKRVISDWSEQIGGPVAVGLMTMAALGLRVHWGLPLCRSDNCERVKSQFQSLGINYCDETESAPFCSTHEAIILVD